jgi:hypothetical protein
MAPAPPRAHPRRLEGLPVQKIISLLLAIVAVIHLLPLAGVLGPAKLRQLYGLPFDEPNLLVLMQHRAVLFGLLGVFLLVSAFRPVWTVPALVAGFVSVVSFLVLAHLAGSVNPQLARVVFADWVALGCLVVAAGLRLVPPADR